MQGNKRRRRRSKREGGGRVEAVGFDVDGTLYHAPSALEEFFKVELREKVLKQLAEQLKVSLAEAEAIFLAKKQELRSNTLTMNYFGLDGERFFQQAFDKFPLEKYLEEDRRLRQVLARLRGKGVKLFIISNGAGRQIKRKLSLLGLDETLFETVVACYDYGWLKPDKRPFEQVLRDLKVPAEGCWYVGDRCETDVVGAKAVGMKAAIIGRGCQGMEDVRLESVYQVEELIR